MKFFVPLALVASAYAAVAADQSDNTAGLAGSSNWDWCGEKAFSKVRITLW